VSPNYQIKKENRDRFVKVMTKLNKQDKIELDKILYSIEGKLDEKLIRLMLDLIFKTNWLNTNATNLYKNNIKEIPDKSLDAFILGSHLGQIYQITLELSKKLELTLSHNQKNILREFIFFLVLLRQKNQKQSNT
jgi:hypothetical protein